MTEYAFALVVDGIDLDDDDLVDRFGEHLEVVVVSESDGVSSIDLAVDADSPERAARIGIHLVESIAVGCRVRRIDLDLVAAAEVADRVGVSRQAVSQWAAGRRSGDSFPESLGVVARGSRVWAWSALVPWLAAHGHAPADEVPSLPFDVITHLNSLLLRDRMPGHLGWVGEWERPDVRASAEDLRFTAPGQNLAPSTSPGGFTLPKLDFGLAA